MSNEPTTQAGRDLAKRPLAIFQPAEDEDEPADLCHVHVGRLLDAILAIEAEARDATGLREALEGWYRWATSIQGDPAAFRQHLGVGGFDRFLNLIIGTERALATAPPEPRWPSRDELAKALEGLIADLRQYHDGGIHSGAALDGMIFDADAILAALRGERP